jgi:hypothetical protein
MQGLKSAILAIFQKSADELNWPCSVSAALKKPSAELKKKMFWVPMNP